MSNEITGMKEPSPYLSHGGLAQKDQLDAATRLRSICAVCLRHDGRAQQWRCKIRLLCRRCQRFGWKNVNSRGAVQVRKK